jgi:S1-C subfamily serine protease
MSDVFGRRTNLVAVLIAGALFFTALGFFFATGIERPSILKAEDLWTDGTGLTPELRDIPSFAPVAERMRPSVVHILVHGRSGAASDSLIPDPYTPETTPESVPPDDGSPDTTEPPGSTPDEGLPEGHPDIPENFEQTSEGSGVIISEEGYILTNMHVVEGAEDITVTDFDGDRYEATVLGSDARDDLALMKIEPTEDLLAAPLGDSDGIRPGDWVMALGNPLGFEYSVTVGVVSGKGRSLPASNFGDFIQTDAAIYPGNSGGPLFDLAGEVIGINTAVIPDTNLGFAVPINSAKDILPQLLENGRVVRGYLGVSIRSVEDLAESIEGAEAGAVIVEVHPGTPAEDAGLQAGDVVLSLDGVDVADAQDLTNRVTDVAPGTRATLVVLRAGERLDIEVVVGSLPSEWE